MKLLVFFCFLVIILKYANADGEFSLFKKFDMIPKFIQLMFLGCYNVSASFMVHHDHGYVYLRVDLYSLIESSQIQIVYYNVTNSNSNFSNPNLAIGIFNNTNAYNYTISK